MIAKNKDFVLGYAKINGYLLLLVELIVGIGGRKINVLIAE
jgi:hypothetical protein